MAFRAPWEEVVRTPCLERELAALRARVKALEDEVKRLVKLEEDARPRVPYSFYETSPPRRL